MNGSDSNRILCRNISFVIPQLEGAAQVADVYINCNRIGAVAGAQLFGGGALGSTVSKAVGLHDLDGLRSEQAVTVNTTASGCNTAFLTS
jgi:delta 1-pyrroline-5-carboxylate dehydrogenase